MSKARDILDLIEAKDDYGVFVYDRSSDEVLEDMSSYYKDSKEAIKAAKDLVQQYSKAKFYIEVWKKEKGVWGDVGKPLWSNY